ncbi:uncharacterized protein LOC121430546 [Lytechinus variegatus]|uniref:uncharacterized protein LOC121430546 n=1 Tax=Lytechinus variegatus TaxID=7654 RepID=UPI001BB16308|nr:uncharacterized protein LOC121430546 [Lytechinus variegatus]
MTNVANERGQVLNSVLTTGEGAGLDALCQGIVERYKDALEPEPDVIYVDRDCCSASGKPAVLSLFRPWRTQVRLDIFHFMRRFVTGLTTEHHHLFQTFLSKISSCIFEWDRVDIEKLREAKKKDLTKSGRMPTDAQVTASITTAELAKHCRRRTRGAEETGRLIQGVLDAMWDSTDSTGLPLINHTSMDKVWQVQKKHLPCIQDVPGVDLYTQVGHVYKGGQKLQVLRCARGSSSLESFHRHQCSFVPGWRCNAMHMQMYMLEGGARWNINRGKDALDISDNSGTRLYDVQMMTTINSMSRRILGSDLIPEFQTPGKPTGKSNMKQIFLSSYAHKSPISYAGNEKIAVEYLFAQSGRGDLLAPEQSPDLGSRIPDVQEEEKVEESLDDRTVCGAVDVNLDITQVAKRQVSVPAEQQEPPITAELQQQDSQTPLEQQETPSPAHSPTLPPESTPQEDTCSDHRGIPGWKAIDKLAAYLVSLKRDITALAGSDEHQIIRLYNLLDEADKAPFVYGPKSRRRSLQGPWRASRKRSGAAPGVQAAERLYLSGGVAAEKPDSNRLTECLCLHLFKEFSLARNRPRDAQGKILPTPQAIVHTYQHIKQLVEESMVLQRDTDLVLVTLNNTTVTTW